MKKKKIIFILLMFFIASSLFAKGTNEQQYKNKGMEKYYYVAKNDGTIETVKGEGDKVPAGAVGSFWSDGNKKKGVEYFDNETSWVRDWMTLMANALDQVTFRLALAMHPFPSVMFEMYELQLQKSNFDQIALNMNSRTAGANFKTFEGDMLLISNSFYKSSTLQENNNGKNGWIVPISEKTSMNGANEGSLQYKKWSIVTVLFITCFVAEILFTAVFGYATGSSEENGPLLKTIAKKAAITLGLFIIVAALPFLLESMRYGLFEVALGFYGEAAENYYEDYNLDNPAQNNNVEIFKLPGFFIRSMTDFFCKTQSSNVEGSLTSALKGVGGSDYKEPKNIFIKAFVWIFFFLFRLCMFLLILKCTLHISVNVIEVYLLLGCTMILTPFAVFKPMKTIGEKCIMSLISNLIECFIIVVIMLSVIPATKAVTISLLTNMNEIGLSTIKQCVIKIPHESSLDYTANQNLNNANKPREYPVKIITYEKGILVSCPLDPSGVDRLVAVWTKDADLSNQNLQTILTSEGATVTYKFYDKTVKGKNLEKFNLNLEKSKIDKIDTKKCIVTFKDNLKADLVSETKEKGIDFTPIIEEIQSRLWDVFQNNVMVAQNWGDGEIPQQLKDEVIYDFAERLGDSQVFRTKITKLYTGVRNIVSPIDLPCSYEPIRAYTVKLKNNEMLFMFTQLTLIILGIYLPCFFVQQSTQITNALLNGNAAMESIANGLTNIQQSMKGAMGAVASFGGNVIRAVNGGMSGQAAKAAGLTAQQTANNTDTIAKALTNQNNKNGG